MTQTKSPKADGRAPLSRLLICTREIIRSEAGPCEEDKIVSVDDPRAVLAPECFSPRTLVPANRFETAR
jgi:hypothetical protein